ncbi:MAG: alpha-ketoglutarate-dependent dioxygenase AlkB [Planctomycetota bacterium]
MKTKYSTDYATNAFDEGGMPPIPGLSCVRGFLYSSQSGSILEVIDQQAWDGSLKRRVQQYGYRYNYKASRLEADDFLGDLPGWLQPIAAAVGPYFGDQETIQQVIVNEYLPGQGIASHVDHVGCFGETVAILSLGSQLAMDFVAPGTAPQKISVLLEPGSLLILRDEARYRWKHGIAGRKSDRVAGKRVPRGRRVSLTFRSVL